MAAGLRDVAGLPDPVGEVVRGSTLANGLELRQVRVPFGVVGIIYEARPNVTADGAGLALKSGNAVLLRGSSSARASNAAIVEALREGIAGALPGDPIPADVVQLVPGEGHDAVKHLMRARGLVDVLIPRGGAALIRAVVEESTVPGHRDGRGQLPRLRGRRRRPRGRRAHPGQREGPAAQRVQRGRDGAGARGRRRRLPAERARRARGRRRHRPRRRGRRGVRRPGRARDRPGRRRRTGTPSTSRSTSRRRSSPRSRTPSPTSASTAAATPRRSSRARRPPPGASSRRSTPPRSS